VATVEASYTGRYLREVLARGRSAQAGRTGAAAAQAAALQ
jgi:hypothetical protein